MKIGIYTDLSTILYPSRLSYVVDFLNDHPLKPSELTFFLTENSQESYISYHPELSSKINIRKAAYLFNKKRPATYALNSLKWQNKDYYYIAHSKESENELTKDYLPFDIFETIFFFISRIEECHFPFAAYEGKKDEYDQQFLTIKEGLADIPIVDHLVVLLYELIVLKTIKKITDRAVSHDIDEIRKYPSPLSFIKKMGGQLIHRKNISRWPIIWKQAMSGKNKDPYNTAEWMLASSDNLEKEIFFLCGGNHPADTPYSLDDPIFQEFVKKAIDRGYHLGIHPSYASWKKEDLIRQEKEILEKACGSKITISRQHYLNFDINITPRLLQNCGLEKDGSLGFSRHVGFRSGTGFDHFLFDFKKEQPSIRETPLVFMDVAAMYQVAWNADRYLHLQSSFLEKNKFNTRIHFLYHNNVFDEVIMRGKDIRPAYLQLISDAG